MSLLKDQVAVGNIAINKQLSEQQRVQQKQNTIQQSQIAASQMENQSLLMEFIDVSNEKEQLEKEVKFYKELLAKPMVEIAAKNISFQETFHKQQDLLGEWMVSQRAFKEIAIQYGLELGKTREEVIKSSVETKANVLNNSTKHGNNFIENDKDEWSIFYAPRIKEKLNIA